MIAAAIMRQAEQRIFRCDRFRRNGVQSGSGDLAAAQGFGKGGAGHKVAAGSVDDECTVLHAEEVVNAWMNSEGHRANILDPEARAMGVGYYYNSSSAWGHQWIQLFTK